MTRMGDTRASSQQWTVHANMTSINRMKLGSREWFPTESNGNGTTTQFLWLRSERCARFRTGILADNVERRHT